MRTRKKMIDVAVQQTFSTLHAAVCLLLLLLLITKTRHLLLRSISTRRNDNEGDGDRLIFVTKMTFSKKISSRYIDLQKRYNIYLSLFSISFVIYEL